MWPRSYILTMRHFFLLPALFLLLLPTIGAAQDIKDTLPQLPSTPPGKTEPIESPTLRVLPTVKTTESYRQGARVRKRVPGFRIQVYTGSNTRISKQKALDLKVQIQKFFPELSVYVHFQSPRWICRAGDFISREEARPYLKKIRKLHISPEASIVACPVLRAY